MIQHSKSCFDSKEIFCLKKVLETNFSTNGPNARKFASEIAKKAGKKWALPLQSGTDALILALALLKLPRNAKIAIPAYSCGAILDAVAFHSLTPVPIDASKDTLGISIESANKSRADAVIAAHLFGIASPFHLLKNKNLIEDCAQCFGISFNGTRIGSIGRFSVFSFYGTKMISTGHGGAISGNNIADFNFAMKILKHDKVEKWCPHLHFLMSDLNAAIGLAQIKKLDSFIAKRRKIAKIYLEALGQNTAIPKNEIFFRFNIIPSKKISQYELIAKFANAGIEAKKPIYKPIFRLLNLTQKNFPVADWADKNLISVPIYPSMTESEVAKIAEFLKKHKNEICCRTST